MVADPLLATQTVGTFMILKNITTMVQRPGSRDNPKTEKDCQLKYKNFTNPEFSNGFSYCKTVFDNYLCWPPTKPGTLIQQNCPSVHLSDPNRYATRRCREDGLWETHHSHDIKASGWTNFTNCFPPDIQDIFIGGLNDDKNLTKYTIAERSRYIEITGYLISCITVIIAIYILCKFRTLQNIRNFIHKHVFYSVLLETTLHLIIFFDQYITRDSIGIKATSYRLKGIDNTPTICEGLYVMAEYSVSAVYAWIFIEGLHLNYLISNNALKPFSFKTYCLCGWTVPLLLTTVWATVVWASYKKENVKVCWFGYNLQLSYWILQGPRASVILCNAIILVRVLNMVVKKLKDARTPQNLKIKKSVKAALFLLPILGLSNALSIFDISIYSNIYIFMAFCYTRQFLKSFQGFFLTLIYCVGNEEVRTIVLRRVKNLFAIDIDWLAPIRWIRPRQQVLNPTLAISPAHTITPIRNESSSSMLQANALNNPVRQTTASSAEIPLAIISYSKGIESDLNNNEDTRQPTFWQRWKKNICCFDQRNNEGSRVDNGFMMVPLRNENQIGSGKPPQHRFALGPNLPSFLNCLRREKTVQRYDPDARLVNRIKDYDDDSNSPLWQLREDVIKLYQLQPKYGNRQDKEEESQKLEPVAGPSKMKRRKLASRRSRLFALKEEELETSMDMSTVSEITSLSSDSSDDYD